MVEKLTEETVRDWDHVIQLLSVCEGKETYLCTVTHFY